MRRLRRLLHIHGEHQAQFGFRHDSSALQVQNDAAFWTILVAMSFSMLLAAYCWYRRRELHRKHIVRPEHCPELAASLTTRCCCAVAAAPGRVAARRGELCLLRFDLQRQAHPLPALFGAFDTQVMLVPQQAVYYQPQAYPMQPQGYAMQPMQPMQPMQAYPGQGQ
jgi:hypothetical protein